MTGPAVAVAAPAAATPAGGSEPDRLLATLRARGAAGLDPVQFHFIEALVQRARGHEGATRRLLDERLGALLAQYGARFDEARLEADAVLADAVARFPQAERELKRLHAAGQFRALHRRVARLHGPPAGSGLAELVLELAPPAAAQGPAELKTLTDFKSTWSRLRVDLRMSPAAAKLPQQAGPLNSQVLALRALELMREVSPAYLQRFMGYLDSLMWLDQVDGGAAAAPRDVVHGVAEKPRGKGGRKKAG